MNALVLFQDHYRAASPEQEYIAVLLVAVMVTCQF